MLTVPKVYDAVSSAHTHYSRILPVIQNTSTPTIAVTAYPPPTSASASSAYFVDEASIRSLQESLKEAMAPMATLGNSLRTSSLSISEVAADDDAETGKGNLIDFLRDHQMQQK